MPVDGPGMPLQDCRQVQRTSPVSLGRSRSTARRDKVQPAKSKMDSESIISGVGLDSRQTYPSFLPGSSVWEALLRKGDFPSDQALAFKCVLVLYHHDRAPSVRARKAGNCGDHTGDEWEKETEPVASAPAELTQTNPMCGGAGSLQGL